MRRNQKSNDSVLRSEPYTGLSRCSQKNRKQKVKRGAGGRTGGGLGESLWGREQEEVLPVCNFMLIITVDIFLPRARSHFTIQKKKDVTSHSTEVDSYQDLKTCSSFHDELPLTDTQAFV